MATVPHLHCNSSYIEGFTQSEGDKTTNPLDLVHDSTCSWSARNAFDGLMTRLADSASHADSARLAPGAREAVFAQLVDAGRAEQVARRLTDAITLATRNPAQMLGKPNLIAIRPGAPANLIRLDASGHLTDTWIAGQHVPGF